MDVPHTVFFRSTRTLFKRLARYLKWPGIITLVAAYIFITIMLLGETPATIRSAAINTTSAVLAIIGSLYLAYELLGGVRGPLKWTTLILTNVVLGVVASTHILLGLAYSVTLQGPHSPDATYAYAGFAVTVIGAFIGVFGGLLVTLRQFSNTTKSRRLFSVLVAACAGVVLVFMALVVALQSDLPSSGQLMLTLFVSFVVAGFAQALQIIIYQEKTIKVLDERPRRKFSWKSSIIGIIISLFFCLVLALNTEMNAFWFFAIAFFLSAFITAGYARYASWKVGNLSKNTLAFLGLAFICAGASLQLWTPVSDIVAYAQMPRLEESATDGVLQFKVHSSGHCTFPPTAPHGKFQCVQVEVKNVSKKPATFKDSDQALISDVDRTFWADTNQQMYKDHKGYVTSHTLQKDDVYDITLVFDIPKDQNPSIIQLHDSSDSTQTDGVKVMLSS